MPKNDLIRKIDLRPIAGVKTRGGAYQPSSAGAFAHDLCGPSHTGLLCDWQAPQFLMRDGSRSLLAEADWYWDQGSRVNGVWRSLGYGQVEIFGEMFAGRRNGPSVGILRRTWYESWPVIVFEVVDYQALPFFSVGARDYSKGSTGQSREHEWIRIGYEGTPNIRLGWPTDDHSGLPQILINPNCIEGSIPSSKIDMSDLIAAGGAGTGTELPDPSGYETGSFFYLRRNGTGTLYIRNYSGYWQLLIGSGYADTHYHEGVDLQATDVDSGQILVADGSGGVAWQAVGEEDAPVYLVDEDTGDRWELYVASGVLGIRIAAYPGQANMADPGNSYMIAGVM